jgi:hypothetical protein
MSRLFCYVLSAVFDLFQVLGKRSAESAQIFAALVSAEDMQPEQQQASSKKRKREEVVGDNATQDPVQEDNEGQVKHPVAKRAKHGGDHKGDNKGAGYSTGPRVGKHVGFYLVGLWSMI